MQTFDQSLMQHVKSGLVTYEEALKHVSNPDDFALRFRGIASTSDSSWSDFVGDDEDEKPEDDGGGSGAEAGGSEDDFSIDRF
jgi:twitching motility protein PilT